MSEAVRAEGGEAKHIARVIVVDWPEVAARGADLFPGALVHCYDGSLPKEAVFTDDFIAISTRPERVENLCGQVVNAQCKQVRFSLDDISAFTTRPEIKSWYADGGVKEYKLGAVAAASSGPTPASTLPAPTPSAPRAPQVQVVGNEWPEPQALPSELHSVIPFAYELLPLPLRGWVRDIAERVQCPPEFPAVGAIVAIGSVLGRKIAVRPKRKDDWEEFPNLWGAIIGRPGVLKSPALNAALSPLRAREANAREAHQSILIDYQAEREAAKVRQATARQKARAAAGGGRPFDAKALVLAEDEGEPKARRYIVNDTTVPALCKVLQSNPNGVLAFRDELSGLLRSMEREGAEGDRAFYLSAYSGKEPHTVDRIGTGLDQRIEHCCLSLLGSIQPHVIGRDLREALNGAGADGLLSRFSLLVWPDTTAEWQNVDRWPDTEHRHTVNELFAYLDTLDPVSMEAEQEEGCAPFLRLDDAAAVCFLEWRTAYERKQRESEEHPALVAHFAKYRKLVPALALIFHLTERMPGPIPESAVLRALGWLEMLESHARRAYASVQQARLEAARTLLKRIRKGDIPNSFSLRQDVTLKGWSGLSETGDAKQAAELLEDLGYVRAEEISNTGGRPKVVFRINPKALA